MKPITFLLVALILICQKAYSQYWNVTPSIQNNGIMEVGKIFDFHESSNDTGDYSIRLYSQDNILKASGSINIFGKNLDGQSLSFMQSSRSFLIGWNRSAFGGETNFITNRGAGTVGGFDFRDINNSGTETLLMKIKGDGNVGIGTSIPGSKLDVYGTIRSSSSSTRFINLLSNGDGNSYMNFVGGASNSRIGFQIDGGSKMSILNNGNVGIGTTTPLNSLHVFSNEDAITWPAVINNNRNSPTVSNYGVGLMLKHSNNGEMYKWGGIASIQEDGWANISGLALYANETEYIRIKGNGNVGIGVTNPDSKLVVDGKIRSEEVKVEIVNGPDYVFEENYNLLSLEETKEYISENKHLPEIPSASEMEANGIDLGDMNMKLLKKVEELTIYLIQMDEDIKVLKQKNALLEASISK